MRWEYHLTHLPRKFIGTEKMRQSWWSLVRDLGAKFQKVIVSGWEETLPLKFMATNGTWGTWLPNQDDFFLRIASFPLEPWGDPGIPKSLGT